MNLPVSLSSASTLTVQTGTIGSMHVQPIRLRYSVNEAAAMLGVSTKTVRRRIKSGQIRATHDGSRVFISWDELDRYAKRDLILKAS